MTDAARTIIATGLALLLVAAIVAWLAEELRRWQRRREGMRAYRAWQRQQREKGNNDV